MKWGVVVRKWKIGVFFDCKKWETGGRFVK